jgi:hypothetical protein
MLTLMRGRRWHAAGGGLPGLTRVWLSFLFWPPMDGRTVLMLKHHQKFRDQRQLLLAVEMA